MIRFTSNMIKRVIVGVLLLPFFSKVVSAVDRKVPDVVDPISTSGVLQMTLGLVVVVFMIFLVSWLVKRVSGFSVYSNPHLKVISGLHVGQKEKLLLVQVSDKQIVVGVTPYSISKLHELETNIISDDPAGGENIPFAERLMQALKKENKIK